MSGGAPARRLLLAVGNPLRGDDGVGWAVAAALHQQAHVMRVQQLVPELAPVVAEADRVVFVDAAADGKPGTVAWRCLQPALQPSASTAHALSPEALLALAERLHGGAPSAVLVTVAGQEFAFREGLSPEVQAALPCAQACVRAALSLSSEG